MIVRFSGRQRYVMAAILLLMGVTSITGFSAAVVEQLSIADFSSQQLSDWNHKDFDGATHYKVVDVDNMPALKAVTNKSASALYKTLDIDLNKTPYLNWSWRVDNVYAINDQTVKAGDDYPARIYVVVKEGFLPWQTKALNYVWSNNEVEETFWANPFTANAVMIPVRSGKQGLGQWHSERVNVKEDFYRIFNKRIDTAHGIAIMSDSDNASGMGIAYYGPISFSN